MRPRVFSGLESSHAYQFSKHRAGSTLSFSKSRTMISQRPLLGQVAARDLLAPDSRRARKALSPCKSRQPLPRTRHPALAGSRAKHPLPALLAVLLARRALLAAGLHHRRGFLGAPVLGLEGDLGLERL